jgi:hypothetical protein
VVTRVGLAAGLLLAGLLSGCGNDAPDALPAPGTAVPATSSLVPSSVAPSPRCSAPFPADTAPDTETADGPLLGLRSAAAAGHPGYDRVVLTLGGTGRPGWRVEYVDQPTSDGSGSPVAVAGSAYLQVLVPGVGNPGDTGVPEPAARRLTPAGGQVVQEVVLDGVFEGQYTAYIGVSDRLPFRVSRLDGPARVVVDVRHC